MPASTSKKVAVYRFDRPPLTGYVDTQHWLRDGAVEVLSPDGVVLKAPLTEVKLVCFVRDWDGSPPAAEKRRFTHRPKTEGLWVYAQFRDNDFLEGIVQNDLLLADPDGFLITPPDPATNNQKIFLPRKALKEMKVLGVVGAATAKRKAQSGEEQIGLFE